MEGRLLLPRDGGEVTRVAWHGAGVGKFLMLLRDTLKDGEEDVRDEHTSMPRSHQTCMSKRKSSFFHAHSPGRENF